MPRAPREPWLSLLPADPRPWILDSAEPAARLTALAALEGAGPGDARVKQARAELLEDRGTQALIRGLPDWEREVVTSGHHSPSFAPNVVGLLADMGLRAGDHPRIERLLDQMLEHQDAEGRFQSFGRWRGQEEPRWGALLCDTHAITEQLVRWGRAEEARVKRALARMASDLGTTEQGVGWRCVPDPGSGFRGPGRKGELCPQVTLEALRTFAFLPASARPKGIHDAARSCLRAWRVRGKEKPYMFGHGRPFKTVKWPPFWYGVLELLEALSGYPSLWKGSPARDEDREALAEMMACLVAYNVGVDGRVTPQSCYKGFEAFSFGQKKQPSPYATARLCAVLRSLGALAEEARGVDVTLLRSSKGGRGKAMPPRAGLAGA